MKELRIVLTDEEHAKLKAIKKELSWRDFLLCKGG